jgi:hypothetical protein
MIKCKIKKRKAPLEIKEKVYYNYNKSYKEKIENIKKFILYKK